VTVAPLPGTLRSRAFQTGPETAFNTPVPATRRQGNWRALPVINRNLTDPDTDTGTLGHALPPYFKAVDVTVPVTGSLAYDDIPDLMCALHKPITPSASGAAITWTDLPSETSQDNFQTFTGEWGDETSDQFQYYSGILESLALTFPEDLSPATIAANWRFSAAFKKALTGGLAIDSAPIWVYGADTTLAVDDTAAGIGGTVLAKSLHGASVTITQVIDPKRFMDGPATRFMAQGYGRGLRTTEFTGTFAKSAAALVEAVNWLNANPKKRYLSLKSVSPVIIPTTAVPYSSELRFAGYWYTRTDATVGAANTGIVLGCHSVFDATLGYNTWWQAVNARAAL
jgi:hypothetical protein